MEPVSIAAGCTSLISNVINLSKVIALFVSEVRGARKDLDAVDRELCSMKLCLQLLHDDSITIMFSEPLRNDIMTRLRDCDFITQQIKAILRKLQSGNIARRIQWSLDKKQEVDKLRTSLEVHKSMLGSILTLGQLQTTVGLKDGISRAHVMIAAGNHDTAAILQISQRMDSQLKTISNDTGLLRELAGEISEIRRQPGLANDMAIQDFINEVLRSAKSVLPPTEAARLDAMTDPFSDDAVPDPDEQTLNVEWSSEGEKTPPGSEWTTDFDTNLGGRRGDQSSTRKRVSRGSDYGKSKFVNYSAPIMVSCSTQTVESRVAEVQEQSGILSPSKSQAFDWFNFFLQAGVDRYRCEGYTQLCAGDFLGERDLPYLTGDTLETLGLREDDASVVMSFLAQTAWDREKPHDTHGHDVDRISQTKDPASRVSGGVHAIRRKTLSCERILLDHGYDIRRGLDQQELNGAFLWAASYGELAIVQLLLKKGAEIHTENSERLTALHIAAKSGYETIVRVLLDNGADIESEGDFGETPLHVAAAAGQEAVVRLLLGEGASLSVDDDPGRTPLFVAAMGGHNSTVQLLLQKGADVQRARNCRDPKLAETPLHAACENKHERVVQTLLANEANVEARNEVGKTALHVAVGNGNKIIVRHLLKNKADVKSTWKNKDALQIAAEGGHIEVVQLLLQKGADVEPRTSSSTSALCLAIAKGHDAVARLLLEKQPKVDEPLLEAVRGGRESIFRLLLEKVQVSTLDEALFVAVNAGQETIIRLLLRRAQPSLLWYCAFTMAASAGHQKIADLLWNRGQQFMPKTLTSSNIAQLRIGITPREKFFRFWTQNGNMTDHLSAAISMLRNGAASGQEATVRWLLHVNIMDIEDREDYDSNIGFVRPRQFYSEAFKKAKQNRHNNVTKLIAGFLNGLNFSAPNPDGVFRDTQDQDKTLEVIDNFWFCFSVSN